jgi:ethanolamine permease
MLENSQNEKSELKKVLSPLMLWGLGVGYVISGMYFGWNLGLKEGGTLGLAIATGMIIIMYACFSLSYSELACAIPKAGGVFDYASKAFGKDVAFFAGVSQIIEFVFAPPAIAFGIGAYFNLAFPDIPIIAIALVAYLIFTLLNIYGVKAAASFELVITIVAVIELLIFAGVTLPKFDIENLQSNNLPNGWGGVFAAIPFAIWFFLGIEGLANVAEEAKNPQKDVQKSFVWVLSTLVFLCVLVFISAVGVGGWEKIVFMNGIGGESSDSPLPLAMKQVVGDDNWLFHLLLTIGLFGLVASFHGLILASGRSTYEFGKVGYGPKFLGSIHKRFKTPANALLFNSGIGILALFTNKTAEIITIAVIGALSIYIIAMFSVLKLRKTHPDMVRPYKVPLYPWLPMIALILSICALIAVVFYNTKLFFIYLGILMVTYLIFVMFYRKNTNG